MSYVTSRLSAPQRRTGGATLGATLLTLLLAVGLPACDGLDPDELLGADSKGKPGSTAASSIKPVSITPNEALINAIGHTRQLQVTVLNPAGKPKQNAAVTWRSLNPGVATVNGKGKVTAVATGLARITATSGANADTAQVEVQQVIAELKITPASATLAVGATVQLAATASDSNKVQVRNATFSWSSARPEIARVDASGRVTKLAEGTVAITAVVLPDNVSATSMISGGNATPPPPSGDWDRVLADTLVRGDVVVPDGQRWLIGRNVQVAGNVRTHNGIIAMRPGSSLKFLGGDPAKYVGGGMHFTAGLHDKDIGLWIGASHGARGMLDIQCTPKTSWNRTGSDPTWRANDEYWIAPTAVGDYTPRRWYPGQPVSPVDPRVPAAEIANVTRDCTIEGPGHIHIHSTVPQRIAYVQLRGMGIAVTDDRKLTSGRYALHLHMGGEGMRGTVVRGVAAIGSRGRVFVPHAAHGVTMTDNVSVSSFAEGLWWDPGDETNDLIVDRLLVMGVVTPKEIHLPSLVRAIKLGEGRRNILRNSVATGVRNNRSHSHGIWWQQAGTKHPPADWEVHDVVAHNNWADGIQLWLTGSHAAFVTRDVIAYHNGLSDLRNWGYINSNRFSNIFTLGSGMINNSNSQQFVGDGGPQRYERVRIHALQGPALQVFDLRLQSSTKSRVEFIDCVLQPGPGAPWLLFPAHKTYNNPWTASFTRCGVHPDGILFEEPISAKLEGTSILIDDGAGKRWEVTVTGGKKVVRVLR